MQCSKLCGRETGIADFIRQNHVNIKRFVKALDDHDFLCAVSLHRVMEIREGQRTETFERFPFERAKNRSFSFIYQEEGELPYTTR